MKKMATFRSSYFILHPSSLIPSMHCLLLYDIPHDGTRTKIADACLDYGLDRVQYSAFVGNISRNLQDELLLKVQKLLGKRDGRIFLLPICRKDWKARVVIEQGEQEMVIREP